MMDVYWDYTVGMGVLSYACQGNGLHYCVPRFVPNIW